MTARDPNPAKHPIQILAELVERAKTQRGWTNEDIEASAKKLGLEGYAARTTRNLFNGSRKTGPSNAEILEWARIFDEDGETWLQRFSSAPPSLLNRDTIVEEQARLDPGDEVVLISSRAFLESSDRLVADLVLNNLGRGITYTYYFPCKGTAYGTAAADSYALFRTRLVAPHSFRLSPQLFGWSVDPARFRFFSGLHTIVHFRSSSSGRTSYCFIEPARDKHTAAQAWYSLTDSQWREIWGELSVARAPMADADLPICPLNPMLRGVSAQYARWFSRDESAPQYAALRPLLGHTGEDCLKALKAEIATTIRISSARTVRYLDVGCGDGILTREIAGFLSNYGVVEVTGVDSSAAQIRSANAAFASGGKFEGRAQRIEDFRSDLRFDVITAIHSMYVIDEAFVRRLFDLLVPGGVLCIWMARRQSNVITALCDVLDGVLRPAQRRNAAEEIETFCRRSFRTHRVAPPNDRHLPGLLSEDGMPTAGAQALINYCALQDVQPGTEAWIVARSTLEKVRLGDGGAHALSDGLIVLQRDE